MLNSFVLVVRGEEHSGILGFQGQFQLIHFISKGQIKRFALCAFARTMLRWLLNILKEGGSTASLGSLW